MAECGCASWCSNDCHTCSSACGSVCSTGCNGGCHSSCVEDCASGCGGACATNCSEECRDSCYVDGCTTTCDARCSNVCYGTCGGECHINCTGLCYYLCNIGCSTKTSFDNYDILSVEHSPIVKGIEVQALYNLVINELLRRSVRPIDSSSAILDIDTPAFKKILKNSAENLERLRYYCPNIEDYPKGSDFEALVKIVLRLFTEEIGF